jgi:DUF4097 and DUF4098 domain-containing protein YvlB
MFLISKKGHFKWMSEALLPIIQNIPSSITVEIRLFTTGTVELKDPLSLDSPLEDNKTAVTITQGRPDLQSLIKDEISSATGDISVNGMLPCR